MANYGEAKEPRSDPFSKGEEREEQFQQIFRRHYRSVSCFFAYRGFDTEECRDLTQETFFRVYRGMEGFRGEAGIKTWLYTIAANIYRNEIRDRQAEKRSADEVSLDEALEQAPGDSQDPLSGVLTDERARLLREAVDGLPPRMRHCVLLRLDRGLKYREIALLLQVTEDTVKAQLFQARQRLYRILGAYFQGFDFN
jgi:RNA polymerase sigma-70 factor (ECF subfamily)